MDSTAVSFDNRDALLAGSRCGCVQGFFPCRHAARMSEKAQDFQDDDDHDDRTNEIDD